MQYRTLCLMFRHIHTETQSYTAFKFANAPPLPPKLICLVHSIGFLLVLIWFCLPIFCQTKCWQKPKQVTSFNIFPISPSGGRFEVTLLINLTHLTRNTCSAGIFLGWGWADQSNHALHNQANIIMQNKLNLCLFALNHKIWKQFRYY